MRLRTSITLVASAAVVGIAIGGRACHKSSEQEAEEAAKATATKDAKESRALRELERGPTPAAARAMVEAQEADEKAAGAESSLAEAVQRERDRYRVLLTKEIDWLDRRIADVERAAMSEQGSPRLQKEQDLVAARNWRGQLTRDRDAIDSPPAGHEWTDVKKQIEHDLDDDNRPASIPKSYEKPYGI